MFKKSLFWLVLAALMNSNNLYANRVYSNISNSNIASLFYKAAQTGNVDAVKNLKAQGYKIDTPDSNGNTALCLAYLNADVRTRDTLLKAGASKKASCMKFSKLRQTKLGKQNSGMIYLNGGLSDTIYSENARLDVSSDGFSWMPWIVGGLVVGGTVAAVMAGGGGGGNNNNVADVQDETIVPDEEFLADVELSGCLGGHWENRNGIPVCTCDDGYELKNGVCVEMPAEGEEYKTADITNSDEIVLSSLSDKLKVQLGARVTNEGTITGTSNGTALIALEAEGFSSAAFSGDLSPDTIMNQEAASRATNKGDIVLTQTPSQGTFALLTDDTGKAFSPTIGELYGLVGLAGGIVINEQGGKVALNALNKNAVYALYAQDRGYGTENKGRIDLNLSANALNAYGIYSMDRSAVNNGEIVTTVTNPVYNSSLSGTVAGVYSKNARNSGKILLRRGDRISDSGANTTTLSESNLNFYGMYVAGGGEGQNLAGSLISLDVTKSPFYNYGIFASLGTSGIVNKGRIELFGHLAQNSHETGIGGAYAIRFIGGNGTILNEGEIETRRCIAANGVCDPKKSENWENLSITGSTYLGLINGFVGTIENKADINLFVDNNANEDARWTIAGIELGQNGNGSGILHSADLNIQIGSGTIGSGALYGILSRGCSATNSGNISIISKTDNLNVYAMGGTGYGTNAQYSAISVTGEGANTALYGLATGSAENSGSILLTHKSSGSMLGLTGNNTQSGIVSLSAIPTINTQVAMNTTLFNVADNSENLGSLDTKLYKGTSGSHVGMSLGRRYEASPTSTNSGSVSISLQDRTVPAFGTIKAVSSSGVSFTNSGIVSVDAKESIGDIDAVSGSIWGIHVNGADITNKQDANVSIQMTGAGSIVGMQAFVPYGAADTVPPISTITNDGTLSITAVKTEDNGGISLPNLVDNKVLPDKTRVEVYNPNRAATTDVPFDIIGIATNSYAVNNGHIFMDVKGEAKAAGMVAYDGGMAVNYGTIEFIGNLDNFAALYGVGQRIIKETKDTTTKTTTQDSSVYNYGSIKINETLVMTGNSSDVVVGKDGGLLAGKGPSSPSALNQIVVSCSKEKCETNFDDYVPGGTPLPDKPSLYPAVPQEPSSDSDLQTTAAKTIVLNDGVRYVSEKGGSFEAEGRKVLGSVTGGISNVLEGNQFIYVSSGAGQGAILGNGDVSGLDVSSASYLFDASLAQNQTNSNGLDIVMTMKSFDDVTDNKSLASFLESNYAKGSNEAFFNDIKSLGNATAFTSAMDSLTGRDTIAKFTHEDLTAMREVNFAMNELMFANNDKPMFETNGSLNTFNFKNDNNSSAQYALANKRISPRMKIGYAMSTTNLNTDNDDDTTRRNSVFQVFAPISYDRSGVQMIATPQIGFARGHYTRKGYNGTSYEGVIEKRIFALMNEARYPMTVSKFEIAPTVEFNAIAYNTKGSEDEKAYSLTMPSDNSLSVEAGLGIYAKRNIGNMKFNAGLMVYREFADPYNIKMGMNGMEGTFDLYDNRSEYRGVASFGFGYDVGKLNVYGNVQHFMETDTNTKFKAGLKFGF